MNEMTTIVEKGFAFVKEHWKGIGLGALGLIGAVGFGKGLTEFFTPLTFEGQVQSISWKRIITISKKHRVSKSGWEVPRGGKVYDTRWEFKTVEKVPSGVDENGKTCYREESRYATKYYYKIDEWKADRNVVTSASSDKGGNIVGPFWGEVGELGPDEKVSSRSEEYSFGFVDKETGSLKSFNCTRATWDMLSRGDYIRVTVNRIGGSVRDIEVIG